MEKNRSIEMNNKLEKNLITLDRISGKMLNDFTLKNKIMEESLKEINLDSHLKMTGGARTKQAYPQHLGTTTRSYSSNEYTSTAEKSPSKKSTHFGSSDLSSNGEYTDSSSRNSSSRNSSSRNSSSIKSSKNSSSRKIPKNSEYISSSFNSSIATSESD